MIITSFASWAYLVSLHLLSSASNKCDVHSVLVATRSDKLQLDCSRLLDTRKTRSNMQHYLYMGIFSQNCPVGITPLQNQSPFANLRHSFYRILLLLSTL